MVNVEKRILDLEEKYKINTKEVLIGENLDFIPVEVVRYWLQCYDHFVLLNGDFNLLNSNADSFFTLKKINLSRG